ncbi:hypothetical protein GPA19_05335 [Azoarcus indigens]|uniref:Uncharacterized protein n=1 Tax=Azoarcus indigens TaxID=29545 RepID=A0A4R6DXR7_9RHOO|nr:hypothetical protein [Azoarcus indigens]NMG64368.1 hypothetical protein [Azoarcus indigens]TDN49178.1 hypothetical protein C7389_11229 [Azoarcus indigens]
MKLKSPTDEPIHVALLSGHAITIGPEARDVPVQFRRDALAKGAIPEGVTAADLDAEDAPPTDSTKQALIVAAIKMLIETDEDALTDAGLPNRKKLAAVAGFPISAEDLIAAWQIVEAETDQQ